ncbi:putative phytol kinase 2, chloroplastic [Bidens hawaiensis]|uniref:putative phytol kinase 2, chloroplastic n=1 Tax=Bidens hawaiensis TaxID=980011 RepID=UPI0040493279
MFDCFIFTTLRQSTEKHSMGGIGGPMLFPQSPMVGNLIAVVLSTCLALSLLRLFEETARRGVFEQKLNRKLVHITIGLTFMLCWPLFSSGSLLLTTYVKLSSLLSFVTCLVFVKPSWKIFGDRYMCYYSMFGFMEISFRMVVGFLVVSVASALVESHPISTKFDDNLTVPLVSVLLGILVF